MKILLAILCILTLWILITTWAVLTEASSAEAFGVAAVCGSLVSIWLTKPRDDHG